MYLDNDNIIAAKIIKMNGEYKLIVEGVSTIVMRRVKDGDDFKIIEVTNRCRRLFTAVGEVRLFIDTRFETCEDIDEDACESYDTAIYDTLAYPGDFIAESYLEIDEDGKAKLEIEIKIFDGSDLETVFNDYCDIDSNFKCICPDKIKQLGKEYEKVFESSVKFNLTRLRQKGCIE